jgi:hypothetical protein
MWGKVAGLKTENVQISKFENWHAYFLVLFC